MSNDVNLGTEIVVDKSMGKWFEDIPQGKPHLTKIIRKPCGVGVEYKDTADVSTGILLQEGAELMERKRFCDMYPKHVATTLQLTEFLHGKNHVACSLW